MCSNLRYLLLSLAVCSLVSSSLSSKGGSSDLVLSIDSSSIENALEKYDFLFLQFYSAQCSVCQSLLLEYPEVARRVQQYNRRIGFGKVNGDEEKAVVQKYQVHGYPGFVLVTKEETIQYTGGKNDQRNNKLDQKADNSHC